MNRALSIALLLGGVALLIFGVSVHESLVSVAREAFVGAPNDRSLWLIIGGTLGIIAGGLGSVSDRTDN
jgi:hypothetical protein